MRGVDGGGRVVVFRLCGVVELCNVGFFFFNDTATTEIYTE